MGKTLNTDLIYEVLSVVEEIPEGCVATYGQIARLTGRDRNARLVGKILSMSEYYGQYPCHRVVNHAGRPEKISVGLLMPGEIRRNSTDDQGIFQGRIFTADAGYTPGGFYG